MNIEAYKNNEFVKNFMKDLSVLDSIFKTTNMNNIGSLSNYMSMIESVGDSFNLLYGLSRSLPESKYLHFDTTTLM